jgi:hypothetical protein
MFRKAVIVLLLMVTPFAQARAVIVCSMTNGQAVERCVCPGEHHRKMAAHGDEHAQCCAFVLEVTERQFVAPAAEATKHLPAKRVWDDVPVIAIMPAAPVVAAVRIAPSPLLARAPDLFPAPLYLRTARLRL